MSKYCKNKDQSWDLGSDHTSHKCSGKPGKHGSVSVYTNKFGTIYFWMQVCVPTVTENLEVKEGYMEETFWQILEDEQQFSMHFIIYK